MIPEELRSRPQWVTWRREERDGKPTKVPYQPNGQPASTTDPATWSTYEEVSAAEGFSGVGFVFSPVDGICGIDLDDIRTAGGMHPDAARIVAKLHTYTERSPSGNGVHILLAARLDSDRHRTKSTPWNGDFEVYDKSRFFTITGDRIESGAEAIEPRQDELEELLAEMFPPPRPNGSPQPRGGGLPDDHDVLDRARRAKDGAKFTRLYDAGDLSGYASRSEAVLALCNLLGFWCGPDADRIDHLFRGSALMDEKWDSPRGDSSWGAQQVEKATSGGREFYTPPGNAALPEAPEKDEEPEEEQPLPWRWAQEITTDAPETPDWLYEDTLAPGDKVMFAGQPKAGKTTFVAALVQVIASDQPTFLSRRVRGGPIVLVSEEGDMTLAPKLRDMPDERVRVLNRDAAWPKPPWEELIAGAIEEALRIEAVMLVIDSVSFWAQFEGSSENESGTAQAMMDVLDGASRAGLVVFLVHHQRRDGGGPRGSGALMGAVDSVIEYERLEDDAPSRHRRLVTESRWPQTPHVLVVEYDHDGDWRLVGEAESRHGSEVLGIREEILSAAPAMEPGASEAELCELIGKDKRKVGGPLRKLLDDQKLKREGKGVAGHPYRYWRPSL